MKRTILLLAIALSVTGITFSGCSTRVEVIPPGPAIVLGAGVQTDVPAPQAGKAGSALRTTRGAILPGNSFRAGVAGWESALPPDYQLPHQWVAGFEALASEAAQPVRLTTEVYYSLDSRLYTWMKAWHPQGTLTADGKVAFDDTPDGTVDVMLAPEIRGNREDTTDKNLAFAHLLSQVRFRVKSALDLQVKPTLTSITVQGVQLPVGIDLAADAVIAGNKASYAIRGITPGEIAFTPSPQEAGAAVLLCPFEGNTLVVDIVTSRGEHSHVVATIADDAQFKPGKVYTITLTYTGRDAEALGATVKVSPWVDVEGGDSEVPM